MNNVVLEGLHIIKSLGEQLQRVPSMNRRRSRGIKLSLLEECRIAGDFLGRPPIGENAKNWVREELFKSKLGEFYIKIFNSFFYLSVSFIPLDGDLYIHLKGELEKLFELQDRVFSGFKKELKDKKLAIVYADMRGTVASASVTSLYCASRILIYRQVFFSEMKSFLGYVEVPIGDSLLGLFECRKNALDSCLEILPYILQNNLRVVIGIAYGKDFLSNSCGRPIIGRDTNLAVRLSELGFRFKNKSIKVKEKRVDEKSKKLVNGEEYYLCGNVDTGIWIADYRSKKAPNEVFKEPLMQIKMPNGIKLVEYLDQEPNVKTDFERFWEEIGYEDKERDNSIYAFIPEECFHVPLEDVTKYTSKCQ